MWWAALCLPPPAASPCPDAALAGLATWALQFTPRVALLDEAVLLEVQASLRLFGGAKALCRRVEREAPLLGAERSAWAGTGLGALALARAGAPHVCQPLAARLNGLPLDVLGAARAHAETLSQIGCRTLADLRALPRGGLSRRFGPELLAALDTAYGLRAEQYPWHTLPDTFQAQLDLQARVDTAPALLFGAHRLLLQLGGWLTARQAGVTALTLGWEGDARRTADAPSALTLRTASPQRDVEHLARLLAEHLAHVRLDAPVERLTLRADEVHTYAAPNGCLLPDAQQERALQAHALERIAARLGADRVLRPVLLEDARPEHMQRWQGAELLLPRSTAATDGLPHPTFLLTEPLRLAARNDLPLYQGPLRLLLGPHRIEAGWWDRAAAADSSVGYAARDYWVARSERAGVLWVFQTRLAGEQSAWFLHGIFA